MPELNEIKKIGTATYIWAACSQCGQPKWKRTYGGKIFRPLCISCAQKKAQQGRHAGPLNPNWTGGKFQAHGYTFVYAPNHPRAKRGHVQEHILVMEAKLGRYLQPGEEPHHLNTIKTDNRPENLELKKHGIHSSHHNKGKILSPAIRNKIRIARLGSKASQETKLKMSLAQRERQRRIHEL